MKNAQFYYWIIVIAFSFGFYVKSQLKPSTGSEEVSAIPFSIPEVIQAEASPQLKPKKINFIQSSHPTFLGKFSFSDTITIPDRWYDLVDENHHFYERDSIDHYCTNGLQFIPAPNLILGETPYYRVNKSAYFPVFIVNETPHTKALHGKDSYVFAIQEAKDSNGVWRPIEHRGFDFCGNGRWILKIQPKEFATFLLPIYEGNYHTDLRVRFKNGDNINISKSYKGTISYEQFYLKPDSYLKEWFKENSLAVIYNKFYGAIPLEL